MWPSGSGCILPVTWSVSALGTRDVLRIKPKVYFGLSSCMCTAEHIAFQSVHYKAHTCALESFILVQLFLSRCYKQRKRFLYLFKLELYAFLNPLTQVLVNASICYYFSLVTLQMLFQPSFLDFLIQQSNSYLLKLCKQKRIKVISQNHQHICKNPKIYFALIKNHSIGQLCNFYGEILLPDYILMRRHRKTWE